MGAQLLKSLIKIFETSKNSEKQDYTDNLFILSGLMIEAANTDGVISQEELDKISYSLINTFNEDPTKVEKILAKALKNKDNGKSLFFYTSKINKNYNDEKKLLLIQTLWEIILSDNKVHDFESNLIRRLAGLLYVSDVECGNAKRKAEKKLLNKEIK